MNYLRRKKNTSTVHKSASFIWAQSKRENNSNEPANYLQFEALDNFTCHSRQICSAKCVHLPHALQMGAIDTSRILSVHMSEGGSIREGLKKNNLIGIFQLGSRTTHPLSQLEEKNKKTLTNFIIDS